METRWLPLTQSGSLSFHPHLAVCAVPWLCQAACTFELLLPGSLASGTFPWGLLRGEGVPFRLEDPAAA